MSLQPFGNKLTVGSLFSGIGGIDLGLERAGMEIRWQVEINPFCQKILKKHWPEAVLYDNITTLRGSEVSAVDVLCGGFPCQDVSTAGKRAGMGEGTRSGLWAEYARLIGEIEPRWIVIENVPGLLSIDSGRGMGKVLHDLSIRGYNAEWDCISAASVGALHRRDRIFIVAHSRHISRRNGFGGSAGRNGGWQVDNGQRTPEAVEVTGSGEASGAVSYADRQELRHESKSIAWCYGSSIAGNDGPKKLLADSEGSERKLASDSWSGRTGPSNGCQSLSNADYAGLEGQWAEYRLFTKGGTQPRPTASDWWTVEPSVGRVAYGVPARVDRLRALGNAVVPQVAEHIGRLIVEAERSVA